MRRFSELSEREILALAIALEEEHGRIYAEYATGLAESYPASAKVFTEMAEEENEHRRWLIDLFRHPPVCCTTITRPRVIELTSDSSLPGPPAKIAGIAFSAANSK